MLCATIVKTANPAEDYAFYFPFDEGNDNTTEDVSKTGLREQLHGRK